MDASRSPDVHATPRELTLVRVYETPRRLVFKAWTDAGLLAQWWGPKGFTNPLCEFDPKPEGAIRIDMRGPDGTQYPMTGVVREIAKPDKLVFDSSPLDENGNPIFEVRTAVKFVERNGKTTVTVHARVGKAGPAAVEYLTGMEHGWSQSLDRLGAMLGSPQAGPKRGSHAETKGISPLADREIVISRILEAPRERVWKAWTDPQQVVRWWGPRGFSTTIETMDVREGGVWKHVMRGPDGTEYPNRSVFGEVVEPERIALSHSGGTKGRRGVTFEATWKFEALDPQRTRVTMRSVFPTAEDRERAAKEYGAVEGGRQTLERLAEFLG